MKLSAMKNTNISKRKYTHYGAMLHICNIFYVEIGDGRNKN